MHHRLGSTAVAAGFPQEKRLEFSIGETPMGQYSCLKKKDVLNRCHMHDNGHNNCCVLQVLMDPLVLSVLYVWCQLNKDVIVQFWFGTRFKVSVGPLTSFAH